MVLSKKIVATVFPRYSLILDQVNRNALVNAWIRKNSQTPRFATREDMYKFINERYVGTQQMDFFEFGVFEGASLFAWTEMHTVPASRFYGFDLFAGLPENWGRTLQEGAFNLGGALPQFSDPRVNLVKGWFQDTLPGFLAEFVPQPLLVLHIDSDLHSSAIYILTRMDSFIKPGTIVIFDEFSSALHEFRALDDYCRAYRRGFKALAMTENFADQVAFIVES